MLLEFFRVNLLQVDFYIIFWYNIIEKRNKVIKLAEITFEEAVKNLQDEAGQLGVSAEEAAAAISDGLKKLYNVLGGNAIIAAGKCSSVEAMNNIKLGPGTLTLIPKDIENFTVEKIEIENERWDWLDDTDS